MIKYNILTTHLHTPCVVHHYTDEGNSRYGCEVEDGYRGYQYTPDHQCFPVYEKALLHSHECSDIAYR